ncbi:3-oxoacid CoA-transferase subunit B [Pontibacterium sp.]|uniref:3-oxoacid CoA-transferase subunit B n=1 Tax=Pontibacterium sp. TaxID=2036026 RepID=UPI003517E8A9
MNAKELIARRVAKEVQPGTLVNLGIGLPTLVANHVPADHDVFFQSENGIVGIGRLPDGMENPSLSDAGGGMIGALPGAAAFDSALSFGLIRGGHLDMTVLGGLQVDKHGRLANWVIPGERVPGMGGAMDLVTCAKKVIVAMTHTAKGKPKILDKLTLPMTSDRSVDLIVTELAVMKPDEKGLRLLELAPGVTLKEVQALTDTKLFSEGDITTMAI